MTKKRKFIPGAKKFAESFSTYSVKSDNSTKSGCFWAWTRHTGPEMLDYSIAIKKIKQVSGFVMDGVPHFCQAHMRVHNPLVSVFYYGFIWRLFDLRYSEYMVIKILKIRFL